MHRVSMRKKKSGGFIEANKNIDAVNFNRSK